MADSEPQFDASADFKATLDLVTAAKTGLIDTLGAYDTEGRELTKTTLERLKELNDPPVSPARTAAAADLTGELADFDRLWRPLTGKAGVLLYTLVATLWPLGLQMGTIPAKTRPDTGGRDPQTDSLARALAFADGLHEAVVRNEVIMLSATVSANAVAATVQEVTGLLIARLNLLLAFIQHSDPAPESTSLNPSWFAKKIGIAGIDELKLHAVEELIKEAAKQLPTHVPVVGIAMSVINITLNVREKQEAFRERRELLEKIAAAYRGANATDEMSNLLAQFQQDDKRIAELFLVIEDLEKQLKSLA